MYIWIWIWKYMCGFLTCCLFFRAQITDFNGLAGAFLLFRLAVKRCVCFMLISCLCVLACASATHNAYSLHNTIFLRCFYYLVSCFHLSRSSSRMSEIKRGKMRRTTDFRWLFSAMFFVCLFIPAQRILVCPLPRLSIFVYVFFRGGPSSGAMHTHLCSLHSSDFLMSSGSLTSNTAHKHTHKRSHS